MSSSEPPQPKRRSMINPSQPGLAVQSAVGVPSPAPTGQPESPPVKVDTLMTGDAKVATHPQSIVGPAPAPQFQTLGRYTIIGELGRGGMGVVYLADDTVLKRKVALKIPQFEPDKAEQMQARFVREAQMAAQLSHINICQIYDVGVIDGQYVMAMEYIDGKTLSGFTKAGKLISERQAVYFVRKVAIAVETAHQKGLIHRDLKPGNIMLPKADPVTKVIEPKVMDFGLAKSLEARTTELTKSGMIVGTPCYMSKEQWSGREAQLGPQCDIYSLGIILYELLTGKLPYDVDDEEPATAWFVKLVTQPQIRPTERKPDVDPALDAIVMRAIAKEAPDRYASMAEIAKDLDAWLKGKAKPAGQSLVGQLPPGLLRVAPAPVNLLLDLGDIESIKSQPSLTMPTRRKPPGAIPAWALWAAGGAAAFLLGITFWFSFKTKPDGTVEVKGELNTTGAPKETPQGQLDPSDKDVWTPLFNGTDVSRWSTLGPFSVDKGQLVSTGGRGNAITRNEYSDFELEAEWRVGKGGNSGIYYREQSNAMYNVFAGNEYSIADDASFDSSVLTPDRRSGSLYGVIAPSISATKPIGEWNQTRIVCRGTTVEHWLNGGRIVRYDTASNEFRQAIAQSTIKAGKENIGTRQTGHILLQSHTGEVAFRSVRIRELTLPDTEVGLRNGDFSNGIEGWECEGGASTFQLYDYGTPKKRAMHTLAFYSQRQQEATGRLFQRFVVPQDANTLKFWVHGGAAPSLYVALKVDEKIVHRTGAYNDNNPTCVEWDISGLRGKLVTLEIVDLKTGIWGFIGAEYFEIVPDEQASNANMQKSNETETASVTPPNIDRRATTNGGAWSIEGDELVQSQLGNRNVQLLFGSPDWSDYDFSFDAKKTGGSHGFKAVFHQTGLVTYYEYAVGNYGNSFHDVSRNKAGQWTRAAGKGKPGVIQADRWYTVRLEVRGAKVTCYLDGKQEFVSDDPEFVRGRCGVSMYDAVTRFRNFSVKRPDGTVIWTGLPEVAGT